VRLPHDGALRRRRPATLPSAGESTDLGPIREGAVYSFTTAQACHLTVSAFFGHQGRPATLVITDATGQIINGPKWGVRTLNPHTMREEFVGVDAGVGPPGRYLIHYIGPTNYKGIWAVCV